MTLLRESPIPVTGVPPAGDLPPATYHEPAGDADLLRRCRRRESAAWDQLVGRYERLVYTVALQGGLTPENAADVTHATFVALIDALDRLRDDERLPSWLMTVARRQAWRARNLGRWTATLDVAQDDTIDPFADWATTTALHDALATLGGTGRDLLVALYFDQETPSYAELARRLGRPVGGIGPLRSRCLSQLRGIMGEAS